MARTDRPHLNAYANDLHMTITKEQPGAVIVATTHTKDTEGMLVKWEDSLFEITIRQKAPNDA